MILDIALLATGTTDATYYSGWDKVGAVAVAVLMLGVLVLLHRGGLKRVDAISDRHMKFVEEQTKVMSGCVDAIETVVKSTGSFHRRLDNILRCRVAVCPVNKMLSAEDEADVAAHERPLAGPQGPLP